MQPIAQLMIAESGISCNKYIGLTIHFFISIMIEALSYYISSYNLQNDLSTKVILK